MIMGDFNMHSRGYLASRDDARARIIRPTMQRYNLNLINDRELPTYKRSNSKTIIDYLFSKIPVSMWLIHINHTSHMMISADIKRKLKASTKIIACTIPYELFARSIEYYIQEGNSLHFTLANALRNACGTSRRLRPIP